MALQKDMHENDLTQQEFIKLIRRDPQESK